MPDKDNTDECMIPLFSEDTDGSPLKRKVGIAPGPAAGSRSTASKPQLTIRQLVLARRNYASVDYLENGELLFDFRIEKSQGVGETTR
jgi:hypothetical protein